MKLKFFIANEFSNIKATVHKTGKLGFSSNAVKIMDLQNNRYIEFGKNQEDSTDTCLYAILHKEYKPAYFGISTAGKHYYVNTKVLFDTLGVKYTETLYIYDILVFDNEGVSTIKLTPRQIKIKRKQYKNV